MNSATDLLARLSAIRAEIDVQDLTQAMTDASAPIVLAEPLAMTDGMSIGQWLEAGRARFAAYRDSMEAPARSILQRIDEVVGKGRARAGTSLELLIYAEAALVTRVERVSDERELWEDNVEADPACVDIVGHLQGEEGRLRLLLGGDRAA